MVDPGKQAKPAPTVIKLGGTTLASHELALRGLAGHSGPSRPVLVHGGGQRLTEWLERLAIDSRFEDGLRVTDDSALEVALAVFGGLVNGELVASLRRAGVDAVGLTGIDGGLLVGERVAHLGRVVRVVEINRRPLEALLSAGFTPVLAPLALDENGVVCNVNADDAAAALAAGMGGRLVMLTDTDGVLDSSGQPIAELDESTAQRLIADGAIRDGMLPKVRGALGALAGGATEVVIADGRGEASVVAALDGSIDGTRIMRVSRQ